MSGCNYLSSQDFQVVDDVKGRLLCNKIRGLSLILFYSTNCKFCDKLVPIFKSLPGTINGCQFGIINVSVNKPVIVLSNQTITKIEYVPYIMLYVNGKPFMTYDDIPDASKLRAFISDTSKQLQMKQSFLNTKNVIASSEKDGRTGKKRVVKGYTTGQPICAGGVCYLDNTTCYQPPAQRAQ